jgi:hypothetical protein
MTYPSVRSRALRGWRKFGGNDGSRSLQWMLARPIHVGMGCV